MSVCPEVEAGLGLPRPAMRLVAEGSLTDENRDVRLVEIDSKKDHTAKLERWGKRRVRDLADLELCGYVFKKDSPSCGVFRVKVYDRNGSPTGRGPCRGRCTTTAG